MKHSATIAGTSALALCAGLLLAGPLSPPAGPVSASYKTLSEVEPRIAINATNTPGDADSLFKITQPGSYYLTGNLQGVAGKSGIEIASGGVTLDLAGFDLSGTAGSLKAVTVNFGRNIAVRDGSIRSWGTAGVDATGASGCVELRNLSVASISAGPGIATTETATIADCRVAFASGEGVSAFSTSIVSRCIVSDCGGDGISIGNGCTAESCSSKTNAGEGIATSGAANVLNCTATANSGVGILLGVGSRASDCTASSNTGDGIRALGACVVTRCTAVSNQIGIYSVDSSTIDRCTARSNRGHGIRADGSGIVSGNLCSGNGTSSTGAGVFAAGVACRIEDNNVSNNDHGVWVTGPNCVIVRNTAFGNSNGNFNVAAFNELAPVITDPGANGFATMTPWSNVSY